VLIDGQRQNGGWGKDDSEIASDLETTYRVMRCFVMLKARPANVEGVRSFVAKCRNEDGGYGVAPAQPSSVSGTYFAAIITHWLKQKSGVRDQGSGVRGQGSGIEKSGFTDSCLLTSGPGKRHVNVPLRALASRA
jgi:hypothetical protein